MTDPDQTTLFLETLRLTMDAAPDGLALLLLCGDHQRDTFRSIQKCSDEHARDLIAFAFQVISGEIDPETPHNGTPVQ